MGKSEVNLRFKTINHFGIKLSFDIENRSCSMYSSIYEGWHDYGCVDSKEPIFI